MNECTNHLNVWSVLPTQSTPINVKHLHRHHYVCVFLASCLLSLDMSADASFTSHVVDGYICAIHSANYALNDTYNLHDIIMCKVWFTGKAEKRVQREKKLFFFTISPKSPMSPNLICTKTNRNNSNNNKIRAIVCDSGVQCTCHTSFAFIVHFPRNQKAVTVWIVGYSVSHRKVAGFWESVLSK